MESKEDDVEIMKRNSRHKGHFSVDHIPKIGSINFGGMDANDHYINLDDDEVKEEEKGKNKKEQNGGLIKGIKQFVGTKFKRSDESEKGVGLLQHDINMHDLNDDDDDESDSELVNLENEYHAFGDDNNNATRVNTNQNNGYNTMILGTGGDD